MARPRPGTRRITAPGPDPDPPTPWTGDRTLRRLTTRILSLDRSAGQAVVEHCVAVGRLLAEAHDRVQRGQWEAWVRATLPYAPRTARQYIAVAVFADDNPAELRRLQHLGLTKLVRLIAAPEVRPQLSLRAAIAIPGTAHAKPLAAMTVGELDKVIAGFASTAPPDAIPIEQVVKTLRYRVAAVDAWTDTLLERADEVDADVVEEVRDQLAEIVASLDEALA